MHQKFSAVFAAVILGAASLSAVAQPGPQGGPGHGPQDARQEAPRQAPGPQARPGPQGHAPIAHGAPQQPPHGQVQRHGAGPDQKWVNGSRVPPQYRGQHYVVNNWQQHGLHKPGRGQQWVQNGSDYLLVAVATGVIAQIVFGH